MLRILLILILFSFQKPEKVWTALGDSITYLNDHPKETNYRVKKGYLDRVKEKIPNLKVINQGYNGWTAVKVAGNIEKLNLEKSDVYTVFLGTNDWWGSQPLGHFDDYKNNTGTATFFGAYRVIIDYLKKLNPEAKIVLISPIQRGDFVYINNMKNNAFSSNKAKNGQMLSQFADAVKTIALANDFEWVDLYHHKKLKIENAVKFKRIKNPKTGLYANFKFPSYIDLPFDPETDEYPYPLAAVNLTYDGLHPSDKGNAVIAKEIVAVFKQLGLY